MKRTDLLFGVLRLPLDLLASIGALLLSYRLRQANIDLVPGVQLLDPATTLPPLAYYLKTFVLPGVLLFLFLCACLRLYSLRSTMSAWIEVGRVIIAALLWLALVIAWFSLVLRQLFYSRILLVQAAFFLAAIPIILRSLLTLLQRSRLRRGVGKILVVSLGMQPLTRVAQETLAEDVHYNYLGHLSNLDGLRRLVHKQPIDLVLQTDPNTAGTETVSLIEFCRSHHVGYGFLPPVLADVPHQLAVERLGLLPMIRFQPTPLDGWGRVTKRIFDITLSAALLVLLWPVFFIIAAAIVLDTGFPISYVSQRVGEQARRRIALLKFRTMVRNAERDRMTLEALNHRRDGPLFKVRDDPRVTRVGRLLRRFSLDELPQLLNVLLGQLSLVGPRPHLLQEVERYQPAERRVFAVKPGITGLAQISGRSDLSFQDEVHLDIQYIEEWSLLLDLWILWRTVFVVLSRKGAD